MAKPEILTVPLRAQHTVMLGFNQTNACVSIVLASDKNAPLNEAIILNAIKIKTCPWLRSH